MRPRLLTLLLLAVAGCRSCGGAEAPDTYAVERMADPYDKIAERGKVNDAERALAAVDFAAQQLGYGATPARVLRARGAEPWAKGLVLLLADGGDAQLKLAWENLVTTLTQATHIPPDLKLKVREGEGRALDDIALHMAPDTLRREYIAEITWTLLLMGGITPDAA